MATDRSDVADEPFDPDWWPEEGDCPDCDGTGEVCCNCDGYGCSQCIDGMRTCMGCDGSGFVDVPPYCEDD